ncbi:MAG: hypothetical protein FJZ47_05430 [Candidatus Tectomicrobia bacterium]|uniref:Uncharacterized protein n=1 Tax=Tectimicrobiota bacterium TaxID=2528274 RepID=A0A937VYE8_UNCTE|nr:hypothetical protein [Candidatus Tectomicrobia bacterium]
MTTIIFGLPTGQRITSVQLTLPSGACTAQELIAQKVGQEVQECMLQQRTEVSGEYWTPEVWLSPTARTARPTPGPVLEEIHHAQQAFAARAYMIVVNNQRIWSSDAVLALTPETQVEFIKILPLVGG